MASLSDNENSSPNIYIPEEWSEAVDSIAYDSATSPPPIAFICGPKNCGKTTFSRYLLNVLLQRYRKVAYLDTDVGQPEFTPPGFLSLTIIDEVTPDMTTPCLKTPERCLFFGDISSKSAPSTYLNYALVICDYYQTEYRMSDKGENPPMKELPLIVNTPGWVKGAGYDLLVDMLKYIAPTHVVKMNIHAENKNLPAGAFWVDGEHDDRVNIIEINSALRDSLNRSVLIRKDAHLLRDMRILSYFRQCFPRDWNIYTIKELARALASHRPFEVPIANVKIQHLQSVVPSSDSFYSLNASIVGLAVDSEDSGKFPWCVGLGIVRGIDVFKGVLYVITPVPLSSLQKVNLLLQGHIQIPTCLLQVQGCISPYMTTNALTTS
ncbi:polynucleotide 5'-hydroxyl-kinase NOL9 [Neltuma alba]|uniref:polynucleotide 5'-hydroxyl-kinase NOL9 n=1 Tax=Neltuma alba TaxID=207710 RepID=UPI0010A4E44B|nr:polynucleotide 5'-hydroxyl-kinase NOL9 [Prosopis alba]